MPFTSRAVLLGATAFLIAASPALGADATVAAVSPTGGTLAIVGLALIAIGAYALARPRSFGPPEDPRSQSAAESGARQDRPVTPARERTAGGAAAAGQQALAYRGVTMAVEPGDEEGAARPEPAYSGARGPLLSVAESEDVQRFLANANPIAASDSMASDRAAIAEQMLEALKAEQARRGR